MRFLNKMGILLPCTLPCQLPNEKASSEQSTAAVTHISDSSSNSSLSSQLSLPSIPTLNPPPKQSSKTTTKKLATLTGHSSYIFSLAIRGKNLYSGCSNGEICYRNTDNIILTTTQTNTDTHNVVVRGYSAVKSITFLGDELLTAHNDHKIRVWKVFDEKHKTTHEKYKCIATLPTLKDICIRFFSAKNYVEVRRHKKCTWVHHVDTISALALTKDKALLYSVSWDRTLKVWRTSDFKCLESVWNAHDDAINAIELSNDGYVYTGSADKTIKIWKKQETGVDHKKHKHVLVAKLEKHKSAVNALALSTDGCLLYSGACDRSIIVWGKDGGGEENMTAAVGALRGHKKAILCLCVVEDLVCSGSADKTVRIWKREIENSHCCLAVLEGHGSPVKCLVAASAPTSNNDDSESLEKSFLVYSGGLDCNINVWKFSFSCF